MSDESIKHVNPGASAINGRGEDLPNPQPSGVSGSPAPAPSDFGGRSSYGGDISKPATDGPYKGIGGEE